MKYQVDMDLPEGAVPQHSVLIVAYFDANGTTRYGLQFRGETSLASILGLLELAKVDAMAASKEW